MPDQPTSRMSLGTLASFQSAIARLNRRYRLSLIIGICVAISLYLADGWQISTNTSSGWVNYATGSQYAVPQDGRSRWRDLKQHYPVASLTPLPKSLPKRLPRVQHRFQKESLAQIAWREDRQAAVKNVFLRCWKAYKDNAWMSDELGPISRDPKNTSGGRAATIVDSLDTLWIMGLKDEFDEAVTAVASIDFSPPAVAHGRINVFETTSRFLGGFLAAYDLSGDRRLLEKAVEVGEMVYASFDTPNRLPVTRWFPAKAVAGFKQEADATTLLAEIASLSLEFTRLSQLTGDNRWYDAIDRIVKIMDKSQASTRLPGMWPVVVNATAGVFDQYDGFGLGAMSDSAYEYLPKMHALLGGAEAVYRKLYTGASAAAIEHTLYRPMVPDEADILIAGKVVVPDENEAPILIPEGQHLVCYAGGFFALAGRLFNVPEHIKIGSKLVDGCIWAYQNSPTGIMPETFEMVPCSSRTRCKWDTKKWEESFVIKFTGNEPDKRGVEIADDFWIPADEFAKRERLTPAYTMIGDKRYALRAEAIESVFVMYRITGNATLLSTAWDMFGAIYKGTYTRLAHAAVSDVTIKRKLDQEEVGPPKYDSMESRWFAETLKYFYLMFSEPELIGLDEWVLTTKAHPLRCAGATTERSWWRR